MIVDVHRLGYIRDTDLVFDATYGRGVWWRKWKPDNLVSNDLDVESPAKWHFDFTALQAADDWFDVVCFDPPYKLNGTPGGDVDDRFGVGKATRWQDRHALIFAGIPEVVRVLKPGGYLLFKCQDQVCSGKVRWQTRIFSDAAEAAGTELVDVLHFLAYRPQPAGRRQLHARRNHSSLLILKKAE